VTSISVSTRVHGFVQGVGYRAWLQRRALSRGLRGWTRNRNDGSVEAVLIGPADKVDEALELMRSGPPGSRVDQVEARPAEPGEIALAAADDDFAILPTV
jgi:acylphosphatase